MAYSCVILWNAQVVVAPKHKNYNLSDEVSSLRTIGVMIPYTAMLILLFSYLPSDFMERTSCKDFVFRAFVM